MSAPRTRVLSRVVIAGESSMSSARATDPLSGPEPGRTTPSGSSAAATPSAPANSSLRRDISMRSSLSARGGGGAPPVEEGDGDEQQPGADQGEQRHRDRDVGVVLVEDHHPDG